MLEASDLLGRVRRIELASKKLSDRILAGEYSSAFKGRGMTYSEIREYQVGDDVRAIDWNVTARSGTPHIKLFEEERELTVFFLIDVSASVRGGSQDRTQMDVMTELTAALSFSALGNNDRFGAILFTDRIEKYIPPRKGRSHVLRIIRDLLECRPQGQRSDLVQALGHFSSAMRKKCIAFVMSDFKGMHQHEGLEQLIKQIGRRHDVIALQVDDPVNQTLPSLGWMRIQDSENGTFRLCNTSSKRVQKRWNASYHKHREELKKLMTRAGIDFTAIPTQGSLIQPLMKLFHERA